MKETLLIALGGAIGSVARYWVAMLMLPLSRNLPWGTMTINITGSFAIAFFGTLTLAQTRYAVPEIWRLAFMIGVCGGFTTFSSFSLQTFEMLRSGAPGRAFLNVSLSVFLCLAATAAGYLLAERWNGGITQIVANEIEEEAS